ncbi:hypothetical protein PsYK624_011110 [Phanerochaete sordida]|uniref:Uncharacterized protein n=1 Tax=Phanerochaete sordida TaxID=48140 RepID=A0A9P3FZ91_9APHY|nr:hypothetical protein PsYK624_011110 [Phanerochaete sordida]
MMRHRIALAAQMNTWRHNFVGQRPIALLRPWPTHVRAIKRLQSVASNPDTVLFHRRMCTRRAVTMHSRYCAQAHLLYVPGPEMRRQAFLDLGAAEDVPRLCTRYVT